MNPAQCRYAKSHEWVRIEGDLAVVGITDHAQDALGDITFLELPKTGGAVEAGKECGVVESVKAASDIYSPVSGTVAAVNDRVVDAPEIINKEPYAGGWLFKVKGVDAAAVAALMDAAAYDTFLESGK